MLQNKKQGTDYIDPMLFGAIFKPLGEDKFIILIKNIVRIFSFWCQHCNYEEFTYGNGGRSISCIRCGSPHLKKCTFRNKIADTDKSRTIFKPIDDNKFIVHVLNGTGLFRAWCVYCNNYELIYKDEGRSINCAKCGALLLKSIMVKRDHAANLAKFKIS